MQQWIYLLFLLSEPTGLKKYLDQGLSPLHSRCMGLISQLPGKLYTLTSDNLYNSVKFTRAAWMTPQKVMCHGVVRPTGRGVPESVKQQEVKAKEDIERVKNTVKASRLVGAESGLEIVCVSVYDNKPVYLLSNACSDVQWVEKKRKVWHPSNDRMVNIPFYRLNVIDFYNYNMGSVDIADQLRTYYRIDHWLRNRKWWWSIFLWIFQVSLTNAYVAYSSYCKMHNIRPMLHRDFISNIVLTWLSNDVYPQGLKTYLEFETPLMTDIISESSNNRTPFSNVSTLTSSNASNNNQRVGRTDHGDEDEDNDSHGNIFKEGVIRRCASITSNKINSPTNPRRNRFLQHLPIAPKGDHAICQLHAYQGRRMRGKALLHCEDCHVNLCLDCFKTYHTQEVIHSAP